MLAPKPAQYRLIPRIKSNFIDEVQHNWAKDIATSAKVAMIANYPDSPDRIDDGVQAVTRYLVDALGNLDGIDLLALSFRIGI